MRTPERLPLGRSRSLAAGPCGGRERSGRDRRRGPADVSQQITDRQLIDLFSGKLAPEKAIEKGIVLEGDPQTLRTAVEAFGLLELSQVV